MSECVLDEGFGKVGLVVYFGDTSVRVVCYLSWPTWIMLFLGFMATV